MGKALMFFSLLIVLSACSSVSTKPETSHHAHAAHLDSVEPDEKGRLLYGTKHDMDPEMVAELSSRPVFSGYTDEQIVKVMSLMGSNYAWPVSDPGVHGDYGVLILEHGFGEHGDTVLREQLAASAAQRPKTLAIGMSMMTSDHIQLGLNGLSNAGASAIIVVPVVSTRHNSLMRQWDYIFARSDEPEYGRVPQVSSPARLYFAEPLDDHPLVGEILLDFANEASLNPQMEEVIIVGHGPVDPVDNLEQLELMENLADFIRADGDFAAVHVITLQDDAPRDVRMARISELRELVIQANQQGKQVIVVTNLLGTRIVQSSLRRALRGLDYRFNAKGLIQHENFVEWINLSVDETAAAAIR